MNRNSEPLNRYFAKRLLILSLFFSVVYGYGMSTLYTWGLDDTTLYYLESDGKAGVQAMQSGRALPDQTDLRQYFYEWSDLPEELRKEVKDQAQHSDKFDELELQSVTDYLASESAEYFVLTQPYFVSSKQEVNWFYVVHRFDREEELNLPGLAISEVVLASALCTILVFLLVSGMIHRGVSQAVEALSAWALAIESKTLEQTATLPMSAIRFMELQSVGEKLARAVEKNESLIEREKTFLQCLSHELRTPMAIIGVALDILETKKLPADCVSKVEKIRLGNSRMKQTADAVLQIWQERPALEKETEFSAQALLNQHLEEVTAAMPRTDLEFDSKVKSKNNLKLPVQAFSLVLNNLLKNALQYSESGVVSIVLTKTSLVVSNPVGESSLKNEAATKSGDNFGYGLGLFIAQAVAEQQGWKLSCSNEGGQFESSLFF